MIQMITSEKIVEKENYCWKKSRVFLFPWNDASKFSWLLNSYFSIYTCQKSDIRKTILPEKHLATINILNSKRIENYGRNEVASLITKKSTTNERSLLRRTKKQSKRHNKKAKSQKLLDKHGHSENERLKRLKFFRRQKKEKFILQLKIENHFKKNFPTTYFKDEFFTKNEKILKGTLDYLEGFVNYAIKAKNVTYIKEVLSIYNKLGSYYENVPRIIFQKADTHAILYHISQSDIDFKQAIDALNTIMMLPNVSKLDFKTAAEKAVELLEGKLEEKEMSMAIEIQMKLAAKFPTDVDIFNKLGIMFQSTQDASGANSAFKRVLEINPHDAFALTNLGIMCYQYLISAQEKELDNIEKEYQISLMNKCVELLRNGMESRDKKIMKPEFYYVYGDALRRLGRIEEGNTWFNEGAAEGLFLNFWQRSPHIVSNLRSKPIWSLKETGMSRKLNRIRKQWKIIRSEALRIFEQKLFWKHPPEGITDTGGWTIFQLFKYGKLSTANCLLAPITCSLVEKIPQITENINGIVLFSMMESGTHINPHSGPSNSRLRIHLGLDIPETQNGTDMLANSSSILRVKDEYVAWQNGEFIVWDDSFDHEVWHYSHLNHHRLIFMFDILHPDLTEDQIAQLFSTF